MATEQFERAKRIFLAASEKPQEERAEWVKEACGDHEGLRRDVESMLVIQDREDSVFDQSHDASLTPLECSTPQPQQIGEFRILGVLGEGGMGVVYLAEQEKPQRKVALKVMRPGIASPTMLRRFEYESQVLAQLHHPGIAQVFAVDKTDMGSGPQPFFVMERIEGLPLTEYADTNKLSTSERLQLVAKICDAVQHAHQKGVIHRDLKPVNILVEASGQPKILDFGIARATDSDIQKTTLRTNSGELIGTIQYMSPEQIEGDPHALDTRSDVYALGIITYELLAGRLPFQIEGRAVLEMLRIIREGDQTPLSSIRKVFRGDIETIVSKAIEKNKSRRYQSASDLAADIEHYLRNEPIAARPPSATYQFRKFVRRNRALVVGVAAVLVALMIGAGATSVALVRTKQAESIARDEVAKTKASNELLTIMLTETNHRLLGQRSSDVDFLAWASNEVNKVFADPPEIKASVHDTIGKARLEQRQYSKVLNARQRLLGEDHPDTLNSMHSLALSLVRSGKPLEAELLFRDSLALTRRRYGEDHPNVIQLMNALAGSLMMQGKLSEAEPLLRRTIALGHGVLRDDHPDVTQPTSNLAAVLAQQGKLSEAEALNRRLLTVLRRTLTEQHPDTLACMGNLAGVLHAQGKLAAAEPILRQVLVNTQRSMGAEHPDALRWMNNLAALLEGRGKFHEAEPLHRTTLEIRRRVLGEEHPSTIVSMSNLAFILLQQGNTSEAMPLFRKSLEAQRRILGDTHPLTLTLMNNLALLLMERGALSEAEPLCRQALETRQTALSREHPHTLLSMHNLAMLLRKQGKTAEAEQLYRRTLEVRRRVLGDEHVDTLTSMNDLADLLAEEGKLPEAELLFVEVMQTVPEALPPDHWKAAVFHSCFGSCLTKLGRFDEAETHLLEAYQRLKTVFGEDHHRTRETIDRLAVLYDAWGKPEKAAQHRAILSQQAHAP